MVQCLFPIEPEHRDDTDLRQFFAFDVIGDLTFGEPFGSLQQSKYHPWIETIIGDLKSFAILAVVNQYKMGRMLADFLIPAKALEDRKANFMFAKEKAMKRQAMTEE